MSNIIVTMKDGTVQRFDHIGCEDERHNRTAIPAEDIAKIEEKQHRGSW
jgi:hypothetical protein